MNVTAGLIVAFLGIGASVSLTKWARIQQHELDAWEHGTRETQQLLSRRKWRYFRLTVACCLGLMFIYLTAVDSALAPGSVIAAVGAFSVPVAFAANIWWVHRRKVANSTG